ncbi:hypothetical protein ACWGOQ_0013680 [Aquimarina sp. M1]
MNIDKLENVKSLILSFENDDKPPEVILQTINKLITKNLTEYELTNYWRSDNLEGFVKTLVAESISDWEAIDDDKALDLINEILSNVNDDSIISANGEALEKRYAKPSGTVCDWIFQDDISSSGEILKLLIKNSTLLL